MSLLPLFLLWFHTGLSQDQWRLVHLDGSVEAVQGTPQIAPDKKAEAVRAWVWSGLRAPRRVSPDQIGREKFPDDAGRLAVRVTRRVTGAGEDHAAEAGVGSICIGRRLGRPEMSKVSILRETANAEENCQPNCT